ncbi:MAG: hypothetical protein WCQ47_05360 [bacterium]
MKFKCSYLLILVLLLITSCHSKKNQIGLPSMPVVTDQSAKQCSGNTWSQTGYEPTCLACPNNSTAIENKKTCVCTENNMAFNARENTCKSKLTDAQAKFLLLQ